MTFCWFQPLIVHGSNAAVSEFPWNVAVYKNETLICGGNIVTGVFLD